MRPDLEIAVNSDAGRAGRPRPPIVLNRRLFTYWWHRAQNTIPILWDQESCIVRMKSWHPPIQMLHRFDWSEHVRGL